MPAINSVLNDKKEKNVFEPVNKALIIYETIINMCMKMPKRYTYLVLQDIVRTAFKLSANATSANSIYPTNINEGQRRVGYWVEAHCNVRVLMSIMRTFIHLPGGLSYKDEETGITKHITQQELFDFLKLLKDEDQEITNAIKRDRKKYVDKYKNND